MNPVHPPRTTFDDARSPTLDEWEAWALHEELRLWQAVALACDLEPSSLPAEGLWPLAPAGTTGARFYGRYQATLSAVGAGVLKVKTPSQFMSSWIVGIADFAEWARRVSLELPPVLELAADRKLGAQHSADGGRWPWGNYETELLRWLAAAAEKFWVNYDPADPSTAENSETVVAWLEAQSLSGGRQIANRTAQIMAQLLRADGLPMGPRKK